MTVLAAITDQVFFDWGESYSLGKPFEHVGSFWKCTGRCYRAFDKWGFSPPALMWAGEVVSQEVFPEISTESGCPGRRGVIVRVGNSKNGHPYVFTGRMLRAASICGTETYWSDYHRRFGHDL